MSSSLQPVPAHQSLQRCIAAVQRCCQPGMVKRRLRQWLGRKLLPSPLDPFFVWQALGVSRCDLLRIQTQHGAFWVTPRDSSISADLFATGDFDFEQFARVLRLVEAKWPVGAAPIFIDIGANIGTHTIYAMNAGVFAQALCFEPDRRNFELLEMNVKTNGYADRARLFNVALGAASGQAELELASENLGDHRVRFDPPQGSNLFQERSRLVVTTSVRTLDEVLDDLGVAVRDCFLHVDVQGYEAFVLAGAHRVLSGCPMMCSEFWPYGLKRNRSWERYRQVVGENFAGFYDVRPSATQEPAFHPIDDLQLLYEEFEQGDGSADVVFVRDP